MTPRRAAPLASRTDPVSVAPVERRLVAERRCGADAGGFADVCRRHVRSRGSCVPVRGIDGRSATSLRRRTAAAGALTTADVALPSGSSRTTAATMTAAAAAPRPQLHRIGARLQANQRARPASAASRTAARCAAVSRSGDSDVSASSRTEADTFSSLTSARASADDSSRRSTDARSASSSSPST